MVKISKFYYTSIFWISRAFSISIFVLCLSMVLHTKFVFSEKYICFITFFIEIFDKNNVFSLDFIHSLYAEASKFYEFKTYIFSIFCKNSQSIDLLLIALAIILILSIVIGKFINKEHKYLLIVSVVSSIMYLIIYSIFKLPILLSLTISTPIILIIMYFLNKLCPIQKIIMLIPVIGEICCTKAIIKYIFQKTSTKATNISLLIMAWLI